jgi:hypothetical protein
VAIRVKEIGAGAGGERSPGWRLRFRPMGEFLLLCWVLGVFFFYLETKGIFHLTRRLLGG